MRRKISCSSTLMHWWWGYSRVFAFILAVTLLLDGSYLLAADPVGSNSDRLRTSNGAERSADSGVERYRVFSLRHISAQKGKEYLGEAKIGTVSQLPGTEMLLVTAQPRELIKVSAILGLVDAKEQFVIKTILPASSAQDFPSNEQIAAKAGNILIGTFSNPPAGVAQSKAIIDIHNDAVVAVAPVNRLEGIISAIEQLQNSYPVTGESNLGLDTNSEIRDANEPNEPNELFDRLLSSLAEAEERAAEQAQEPAEPNEPNAAAALPEVKVTIEPAAAPEPGEVETRGPAEPDLAAILKRLEALEAGVKAELEPKPEPAIEEAAVEIEQPNEVAEPVSKESLYEPKPIANGEDVLKLSLPEKLPIGEFLGFVGEHLHLDYLYDPAKVKGDVTLRLHGKLRGDIQVKELYPLLESVLQFHSFAMTRKGDLVTIRPMVEADLIDPPIVHPEGAKVEPGDVIITRVFELRHIDTASVENLLKHMKLGVAIKPIAGTGMLIVTGYAYRMRRIEELLEMVDKPGEPRQFRFRQLKYTMAETLAPKVKTLAEQLGTISVTIAAPAAAPAAPRRGKRPAKRPPPKKPAPTAPAAKAAVYLEADKRTNRILMIGLAEQLAVVDELIDKLDVEQRDLRTLRLYEIQYVDAEEAKKKLEEIGIISAGKAAARGPTRPSRPSRPAKGEKAPTPVTPSATGEALVEEPQVVIIETVNSLLVNATPEQHAQVAMIIAYVDSEPEEADIPYMVYPLENQDPEELATILNELIMETTTKQDKEGKIVKTAAKRRIEEDIIIIPDQKTYSLIVYASKRNQQWISSLIRQLDEYRPQVLLDVTLVEITKNDDFILNLSLFTKHPTLREGGGAASPDFAGILEPFPDKRILEVVSTAGAGAAGFYADEHIQAIFDTMQKKDYGRVLARPKLLVNDNETGTIKTEETVPIVSVETKIVPGTAAQASTAAPSVKIDTYTAGISLDIEPHISKGDQLRLTIKMTRIDFRLNKDYSLDTPDGAVTGPTPPDLLTSDVTTVVTVPDNHTIILGGLERLSQSKGGTKVPILGDIPILGGLFRNTANTDSQNRLYVFVKAHILRPGEALTGESDIELVSAKNRVTFEKYEEEMQKYEDWPGIKPQPMDPLRILEAD